MDEAEDVNTKLIIAICCLTGLALIFLVVRISSQVLKRCDILWDGFTLIASWIGLSSLTWVTPILIEQRGIEHSILTRISTDVSISRSFILQAGR